MLYIIVRFVAFVLFKILFRLEIFGRENIPSQGRVILASNHVSYLDPPMVGASCPRIVSFLAKEGLFKNPLFGWFITHLNAFPIKTKSGDLRALRWAIRELKADRVIVIFPEGGRVEPGMTEEPRRGVGLLIAKTSAPVVPVFIKGAGEALPVHAKSIRLKKVKVYFGRPVRVEKAGPGFNKRDFYHSLTLRVMDEIDRLRRLAA
jgi:1-acyl-sn-glycerol-3-phosphate acyltransferase